MSVVGKIGKGFAYSLIGRLPAQLKTQRERLGAALGGFARHRQEGGTPIEALDERDLARLARLALVETLIMGAALLGCIVWGARKVQAGDGLSPWYYEILAGPQGEPGLPSLALRRASPWPFLR